MRDAHASISTRVRPPFAGATPIRVQSANWRSSSLTALSRTGLYEPYQLSLPTQTLLWLARSDWALVSGVFALDRTVAPSGPPAVTRRKSSPAAAAASQSSPTARTRIIYREAKPSYGSDFPFWQQSWFIGLLFLMAIGFFALAVFLFLGLDVDQGSPSPSYAATSEGVEVWIHLHLYAYSPEGFFSIISSVSLSMTYALMDYKRNSTHFRCQDTAIEKCYLKSVLGGRCA